MGLRLSTLYVTNFLMNLLFAVMAPFYPPEALDKGLDQWQVGLIFSTMPIVTFLVSPWIGNNLKTLGRRRTFTVANLFSVLFT